jgi:hypothetical protein
LWNGRALLGPVSAFLRRHTKVGMQCTILSSLAALVCNLVCRTGYQCLFHIRVIPESDPEVLGLSLRFHFHF